ncbi:DNAase [Denitratisoma sp. DHT3]|uniref:TatD family hydrolase n=1 Tax=Denitratisoma sp. DHT3 TaxID=1981880 RepID=UPI0011988EDB|nr:TatD family hydrolase [Denitratisoma sp. DHT3]QDX82824.1 DNAase [Denitratisoma sp. DHT3]
MLVDSHCHLNFPDFASEIPQLLDNMRTLGVGWGLCAGVTLEDFPALLALVEAHPNIYGAVGVHPDHQEGRDPTEDELVQLAAHPKVVAIGETGLDYYRLEGDLEWQRQRFRRHIRAALRAGKPLIIHTRSAAADTLAILREEGAEAAGGVFHCFTESMDVARQALDLGFHISFSGIVTFKNAIDLKAVARQVPLDRLLVETDCPYLAPVPHRGKRNEPAYVRYVAEEIARLRDVELDVITAATTRNFFELFRIPGAPE